ncbi:hypothetical protein PsorP6_006375 [Peronosclerospora sorghi]|uniref:Uncharacterized protein n=1 Tax=Peronosclerospora sorghi TaxID=230839 RepID=A0ACC0W478_9STRA|nr:hypothetical protein PsorP6_006375 [Peronosclerospora sorghi]
MAIRGTSAIQDGRYFDHEKKLLASMTFPSCFEKRVDMRKVQRDVIYRWVTERITQLLGFEDDIVVSMAINLLEPRVDEKLDPKQVQLALTGFLEKQAGAFMEELWQLLLSAQTNPTGIPSAILDQKKQDMEHLAAEKARLKHVLDAKKVERRENERGTRQKEKRGAEKVDERRSFRREERSRLDEKRRAPSRSRRTYSPAIAEWAKESTATSTLAQSTETTTESMETRTIAKCPSGSHRDARPIPVLVCETPSLEVAVSLSRSIPSTTCGTQQEADASNSQPSLPSQPVQLVVGILSGLAIFTLVFVRAPSPDQVAPKKRGFIE